MATVEKDLVATRTCSSVTVSNLPEDILFLILEYLEAWELLRCQLVSHQWQLVFSQKHYIQFVLNKYQGTKEMRDISKNVGSDDVDWKVIFQRISSRYFHLTSGKARRVLKYEIKPLDQMGYWYPIGQWDYHESQPGGRLYPEHAATHLSSLGSKPYLFPPTLWSYDDGLVVFAPSQPSSTSGNNVLCVLDIESHLFYPIPFNVSGKIIRNLRLKDHTLIIEWAEKLPYHDLNAAEKVHRHFVSCFDILPNKKIDPTFGWLVQFRSEWKSHFLGLPLSSRDRFFSTHTKQHYCIYLWQPNRSMYTGDEDLPIEALFVWDISTASPYRPSEDPTGKSRPSEECGPHMVARFAFRELDFLGIRQHASITFMSLHLHSASYTLKIRQNICENGQGYFDPAERLWCATTTTFPFLGFGPCYQRMYDGDLPPYRGHCTMETTDTDDTQRWFLPIMDLYDESAKVRFSLVETCFTGLMIENKILVRIKALDAWYNVVDDLAKDLAVMGRIAGDERWLIGQNSKMQLVVGKFQ